MSADNPIAAGLKSLKMLWCRITTLGERQRFYLLLMIFNTMLVFILLQGWHRQALIREITVIETREYIIVVTITRAAGTSAPTAMPTFTPTPTPTSTATATASITPTPLPLILSGITPTEMVRLDTGPPVLVTITGANFVPEIIATLGSVPVTILAATSDTITGTVPISIPGVYDLTVTNPGRQTSTLLQVFTVREP